MNIQTPANSAVRLAAEGSTVVVGPSSNLVYEGDAVQLRSGSTMVTTDKGIKTQVQRWLVVPAAKGHSSYRVARGGGQIQTAALHGAVKISDGNAGCDNGRRLTGKPANRAARGARRSAALRFRIRHCCGFAFRDAGDVADCPETGDFLVVS